jgi:uncharacterized membrane protein YecN with MAPEG domain
MIRAIGKKPDRVKQNCRNGQSRYSPAGSENVPGKNMLQADSIFISGIFAMTTLTIIPLYLAPLAALYLVLSFRIIGLRRAMKVALGHAGDKALERAIRVHGNFNEYVPLIGLLLVVLELKSAPAMVLHILGAALLVGRLLHAYGMSQVKENFRFRVTGMLMTFATLAVSAIALVVMSVI